ncbi:MAG: flagellar hook-basal body complex protein [Thermohalobaculum sp.]|nr:flagellar hook-basal body complex protein [Thermohalobaculum sp.]
MSLSSSLNAGVAGLQANSTRLAVISDNIANSSTQGFRRADVDFASLVIPGSPNSFAAGGVRASAFREVSTPGTVVGTSNATDISVNGRGMLPVTLATTVDLPAGQRPFQLTATGAFQPNDEGFLVTRSGLALLGFPTDAAGAVGAGVVRDGPASLEPVRLTNFQIAAEPTTQIELGVNLPAAATDAGASGAAFTSTIEYFDGIGRDNRLTVTYTPTVPATGSSNAWTITIDDSAPGSTNPIAAFDVTFDDSIAGRGTISAVTPVSGVVYDATTGIAGITTASGPIDMLIGGVGLEGGLTQLATGFTPTGITANGARAGNLTGVEFDSEGTLLGVYDTGQRLALFRIPVVDVPNPNGLTALDNQAFAISSASGQPFLWDANTGPVGGISGFSLQQSTVDIAKELTSLIQTQRAYSSNATTIRTVDEMLQETTNLKR